MNIRRMIIAAMGLCFCAGTLSAAQPQDILWGLPYLQNMTTDGVTVMYQSRGRWLRCAEGVANLLQQDVGLRFSVSLKNLIV